VIALIRSLQSQAAVAGGGVEGVMGNHEATFLARPDSKKVEDFAPELDAEAMHPRQVANCQGSNGQFLCSLPFAVRINDWSLSHAGNTHGRSVEELSADLQHDVTRHGFGAKELSNEDSLLEADLGKHPWFERDAGRSGRQVLTENAAKLGISH